jgi:hypothetical protein
MIEFVTADGDHVYVARDKVVLFTQAKSMQNGATLPVLGMTLVVLTVGPPIVVKGSPAEVRSRLENEDINIGTVSNLFSPA